MEDPEFLDKEKSVRQNRQNGLVVSGLQYSDENEFKDLMANLLVNEMNLPATAEQIGYCQPVQGIEFRKKGSTTQLVKIRFYEDESVPYNRDDVLSRYTTLRNTNLWRHKEVVLNPELRTMGPPRPLIRESLLQPFDFLPQAPVPDEPMFEKPSEPVEPTFVPPAQRQDDDEDLVLPQRSIASSQSTSKPFNSENVNSIVTKVRANLNNILKPATRFELPRTFTSVPPPPPSQESAPTTITTSKPQIEVEEGGKQPVFHSVPPPPVNLPASSQPKMTINIQRSQIGTSRTATSLVDSISENKFEEVGDSKPANSSIGLGMVPSTIGQPIPRLHHPQGQLQQQLQEQMQQPPPPLPMAGIPSHLSGPHQQLGQTRFTSVPAPLVRPSQNSPLPQQSLGGAQFPFNIPPLLSNSQSSNQPIGPYTNSIQAQQHLQQLLQMAAVRAGQPGLFSSGLQQSSQQQQLQNQQNVAMGIPSLLAPSQNQPQHHSVSGRSTTASSSPANPYARPKSKDSGKGKSLSSQESSSKKSGDAAPKQITEMLSLAKKLGFNIKTTTSE